MATLHDVIINALRWLVSRLAQVASAWKLSRSAQTPLAHARSEILKPDPDLQLVRTTLDRLTTASITALPEYDLAQKLLVQVQVDQAKSKTDTRISKVLRLLPPLIHEPAETRVREAPVTEAGARRKTATKKPAATAKKETAKKKAASTTSKKKTAKKKAAKKKAVKKKATKKKVAKKQPATKKAGKKE